jgi:hypothetical protein
MIPMEIFMMKNEMFFIHIHNRANVTSGVFDFNRRKYFIKSVKVELPRERFEICVSEIERKVFEC